MNLSGKGSLISNCVHSVAFCMVLQYSSMMVAWSSSTRL